MSVDDGKSRNAYRVIKTLVTSGELRAGARLDPEELREIADRRREFAIAMLNTG